MRHAAARGDLPVLDWAWRTIGPDSVARHVWTRVCNLDGDLNNNGEATTGLADRPGDWLVVAARHGHMPWVMDWYRDQCRACGLEPRNPRQDILMALARGGHLLVLKSLLDTANPLLPADNDGTAMMIIQYAAAAEGHLDILQWSQAILDQVGAREHQRRWKLDALCRLASGRGHLPILGWWRELCDIDWQSPAFMQLRTVSAQEAIGNGHLDVAKFWWALYCAAPRAITDTSGFAPAGALQAAVHTADLAMIQWMWDASHDPSHPFLVVGTPPHVLDWKSTSTSETNGSWSLTSPSKGTTIPFLEWWYKKYTQGRVSFQWTATNTYDCIVSQQLDVLEWAWSRRQSIGFEWPDPVMCLGQALSDGRVDTLRWWDQYCSPDLRPNPNIRLHTASVQFAAAHGHLAAIQWWQARVGLSATDWGSILGCALAEGQGHVLAWWTAQIDWPLPAGFPPTVLDQTVVEAAIASAWPWATTCRALTWLLALQRPSQASLARIFETSTPTRVEALEWWRAVLGLGAPQLRAMAARRIRTHLHLRDQYPALEWWMQWVAHGRPLVLAGHEEQRALGRVVSHRPGMGTAAWVRDVQTRYGTIMFLVQMDDGTTVPAFPAVV
ncbi:hypothetical protein BC828DRAFT_374819 [Blastocladiella britannica]|nr:hypothetical protein BC828DRAFT_374819 [Blastocladiella britannica]